jgi:hypothetical protein
MTLAALALVLTTTTTTAQLPASTTSTMAPRERRLCEVTPELRIAVLHGSDAEGPATALAAALKSWDCLKLYVLPVGIPMKGDLLPEGATRIADRIGVDWIITVSPGGAHGYATARLVELSNLTVVAAKTGRLADVANGLLTPVHAELRDSKRDGVRVTVVLDAATYQAIRALENDLRTIDDMVEVGASRLVDNKGIVVVKFKGSVDSLAAALDGRAAGAEVIEVTAVKLRRLELRRGPRQP